MVAIINKLVKLPIKLGEPLFFHFEINGRGAIRRPKTDDVHNCFAAEDIVKREVLIKSVKSPIPIYLAINYRKKEKML